MTREDAHTSLLIRACKSRGPVKRQYSYYKHYYLRNDSLANLVIVGLLLDIITIYKLVTLKDFYSYLIRIPTL